MKRLGRVGFLEHISSRVGVLLMSEMCASVMGISICVAVILFLNHECDI